MTEQHDPTMPEDVPPPEPLGAGESGAGEPVGEPASEPGESPKAREWLSQLQAMIDDLATQAAPTVRQVGAKAAELAAVAGEKAGPIAQRAAEITGEAGQKLAERSRHLAEELRRDLPGGDEAAAPSGSADAAETVSGGPADLVEPAADAADEAARG